MSLEESLPTQSQVLLPAEDLELAPGIDEAHIRTFLSGVTAPEIGLIINQSPPLGRRPRPVSLNELQSIPKYNKVSQSFLIERAKNGDPFALEQLCINSISLVKKKVDNYFKASEANDLFAHSPVESDDLVQVGLMEVPAVLSRFENSERTVFFMYLGQRVVGTIMDEVRSASSFMGLPRSKYKELKNGLKSGTYPDNVQELIEQGFVDAPLFVKDGQITVETTSLEAVIDEFNTNQASLSPDFGEDIDIDPPFLASHVNTVEEVLGTDLEGDLAVIVDKLPETQRFVLISKYGLFGVEPIPLHQIGEKAGFTESRASQYHTQALSNLRKMINGEEVNFPVQQRGALANLPNTASRKSLTERVKERLEKYSDSKLHEQDIFNVLSFFPEWQAESCYIGVDRLATLKRRIPFGVKNEDIAKLELDDAEKKISVCDGKLIMKFVNMTGKDMQTVLEIESTIFRFINPKLNESVQSQLRPQEQTVLSLLFKTYQEIALDLGVSESTIRTHAHNVMSRYDLKSAPELAVFAVRNGLIDLDTIPEDHSMANLSPAEAKLMRNFYASTYDTAANQLNLSNSTIRTHWHNIFTKSKTVGKLQATLVAIKDGLIPLNEEAAESAT